MLVGVGRVTVVHIGHDEVVVVIHFLRSHFCRDFRYQEMFPLHQQGQGERGETKFNKILKFRKFNKIHKFNKFLSFLKK